MTLSLGQLSYIIGFLHSDGHLYETSRNRGKLSIELNKKDIDILVKLQNLIGGTIRERERATNFGYIQSVILTIHSFKIRTYLKKNGLIAGKKSSIVSIPNKLSITNYLRGFVDGDGSIGTTGNKEPFVSIVTSSEMLKDQICNFLGKKLGLIKALNRNKRDKVYNIVIKNENAIKFCRLLYYKSTIHMNRKYDSYKLLLNWKRTKKVGNKH
jgi:sporulation protein YlmC with PRC-barrel domain